MTIATTAPQKFAFQDLVCVDMVLRFCEESGATLLVEPDGGEDAELSFTLGGRTLRCEIQVKGAGGAITLADIASCLAHTPPRRADRTLLERLLADPDRMALLVMSGRADDASSIYLGDRAWRGQCHLDSLIRTTHAKGLITALAVANVAGHAGGTLKIKRQKHNAALAGSVDAKVVREALGRVVLLDQVNDAELDARCTERLRRYYGVPSDRTAAVLLELRAAVVEAKSNKWDAFPPIRNILARASPQPIRPADYVERGDEAGLVDGLSRENVLLLSGTPRVGKTFAARRIAAEFMPIGYDVQEFVDVDAAERFLLEPGAAPRLALLDDPLGGAQVSVSATRSLTRLNNLIGRTRPQRKLLVAQGLGPLLATARTVSLENTATGHRRWRDMGGPQPIFLVALWRSLASAFAVEATLRQRVADALADGSLVLEPGCLEHLAASAQRLSASASIASIVRLAREDAAQLGRTLAAEGLEGLAIGLSVTTAPQESIQVLNLAYVRGSGGSSLPSKRSALDNIVTFGGSRASPSPAPVYESPPELAAADQAGLDVLERRRMITIDARTGINFAHPFYRAAAETLLDAPTYHAAQSINHALERGLFCLSSQTSRATARNLEWIFDSLKDRPGDREALVAITIEGLSSLFPATRDLCFRFLLQRLSALPLEQQQDLPTWIHSVTSIRLDQLEWRDGEAHLSYGQQSGIDYLERAFQKVRRRDVATELELFRSSERPATPEQAAAVLRYFVSSPGAMTLTIAGRLLSYDEAAVRAMAIRLWLGRPRKGDNDILDRIFADDHPSCALAALKGVILSWRISNPDRRTRLIDGLVALAGNIAAAAAMLDHLVLFDRVEHTGENPPWPIFERLMPTVMAALPHNAAFVDARLFAVAQSALAALAPTSLVAFCDGWIEWLERNERADRLPSEFSLGITEILLHATAAHPELRGDRVARLLSFTGTGAKLAFTADLVRHWELLRTDERAQVLDRLTSGYSDNIWLQAVALTRSVVPDQIVRLLLPAGLDLTQAPERLVDAGPPALIENAVLVYIGRPQPLWWLGTHHSGEQIWEPVVELIARRPNHRLFELAWDDVAYRGDGKRVARIIADLGQAGADRVLRTLLRVKVGCTGNFMPEAWATLLRLAANQQEHDRWLDQMAEAVPAILDDISDLRLWLTQEDDFRGMLDRLKADIVMMEMSKIAFDPPDGVDAGKLQEDAGKLQETVVQALALLVRERPPLLYGTCDRLLKRLSRATVDTVDIVAALDARRVAIFAERNRIEAAMELPNTPLVGWINP